MTRTRPRAILGLLVAMLLVLSACADDTQDAAQDATSTVADTAAETTDTSAPTDTEATEDTEAPDETEGTEAGEVSGTVEFYTSQPDADYEALISGFNELYPDVTVNVFRSGTEEVMSRLLAENEAGAIQADVLLVADEVNLLTLKEMGLLASYESPEHAAIPSEFVDEDFTFTGTKLIDTAMVINTNLVEETPTSWWDLVENADSAVMPSPQYSGAAAYNMQVLTRQPDIGWEFYEQLAANGMTVVQGNGGVLEGVATGQYTHGMVVSFIVARAAADGSPVEVVYPEEGVLGITEPVAILEGAQNRAAAEALVDYILSEAGQQLAVELGYTPLREGVEPPAGLPTVDELDLIQPDDLGELIETREDEVRRFIELFGEG
ncbi:MAG TPA: ABC transporter substrate-binding protein [Acidimicrobiia bacterium]|nr:ABC transporter substrate-binding protein [Acidimicrobiia bacterium]